MSRLPYPSDLDDEEWELLRPYLEVEGGRPMAYNLREVANAVYYRIRTGCQWRYLPHDLPQGDYIELPGFRLCPVMATRPVVREGLGGWLGNA